MLEHTVYYFGPSAPEEVMHLLGEYHNIPTEPKSVIPNISFREKESRGNKVYLVDFPMVQAEVLLVSKGNPGFNIEEYLMSVLYNDYFGSGLSSIVFQDIRESKGLAYSTYAQYLSPARMDRSHFDQAFVGTQTDKLADALPALKTIIEDMPVSPDQVYKAIEAVQKRVESDRILPSDIYWVYRSNLDRGITSDLRRSLYDRPAGHPGHLSVPGGCAGLDHGQREAQPLAGATPPASLSRCRMTVVPSLAAAAIVRAGRRRWSNHDALGTDRIAPVSYCCSGRRGRNRILPGAVDGGAGRRLSGGRGIEGDVRGLLQR